MLENHADFLAKRYQIFLADGEVLVDTTDVDDFFDNPSEPRAQQFLSKIINHESDKVK